MDARLVSFVLVHSEPARVEAPYREFSTDRLPSVSSWSKMRYQIEDETPDGRKG